MLVLFQGALTHLPHPFSALPCTGAHLCLRAALHPGSPAVGILARFANRQPGRRHEGGMKGETRYCVHCSLPTLVHAATMSPPRCHFALLTATLSLVTATMRSVPIVCPQFLVAPVFPALSLPGWRLLPAVNPWVALCSLLHFLHTSTFPITPIILSILEKS